MTTGSWKNVAQKFKHGSLSRIKSLLQWRLGSLILFLSSAASATGRKRLSAIESPSYLAQQDGDSQYRAILTEMLETIDSGDKTLVLNYELTAQEAFKTPIDPDNPQIDLVKGYTNLKGRVNK